MPTGDRPFAKRSLGQNFLVDETVVDRILDAFAPRSVDRVLEIGPGRGALTRKLVDRVGKLYALEFDRDLAADLKERFREQENFQVIEGDALEADLSALAPPGELRLIANLPYNISTAILRRLFDHRDALSDCVLMFQREVAERITAAPGSKQRGYLTVLTEANFKVKSLFDVPPGAFRPVPKVWSSVVRLIPAEDPADSKALRDIVSNAFAQKRKTILNNLKLVYPNSAEALERANVDRNRRPETLSLKEWVRLSREINGPKP